MDNDTQDTEWGHFFLCWGIIGLFILAVTGIFSLGFYAGRASHDFTTYKQGYDAGLNEALRWKNVK